MNFSIVLVSVFLLGLSACAPTSATSTRPDLGSLVVSDLKWTANNAEADLQDIVTSALRAPDLVKPGGLVRQPEFYYSVRSNRCWWESRPGATRVRWNRCRASIRCAAPGERAVRGWHRPQARWVA